MVERLSPENATKDVAQQALGINNHFQIVGVYFTAPDVNHGFMLSNFFQPDRSLNSSKTEVHNPAPVHASLFRFGASGSAVGQSRCYVGSCGTRFYFQSAT